MNDHVLKYSLESGMPINVIYMKGMEISQRQIQVRRIEGDMIHGYCYKKHAMRSFKMENILAAMIPGIMKEVYDNRNSYI